MINFKIILICILLVFIVVLFIFFIRSLLKKESAKYLVLELGGCIAFIIVFCVLAIPGSETNFEMGPVKYKIKTPSEVAKLIGDKEKTFAAQNTDKTKSTSLTFSGVSTSPTTEPNLHFLVGEEYITNSYVSKDGRERIFSAVLPPGKELKTAIPDHVEVKLLPKQEAKTTEKEQPLTIERQ